MTKLMINWEIGNSKRYFIVIQVFFSQHQFVCQEFYRSQLIEEASRVPICGSNYFYETQIKSKMQLSSSLLPFAASSIVSDWAG